MPPPDRRPDLTNYDVHNQADYEEIQSILRRMDGTTPPSREELDRFVLKQLAKGNLTFAANHEVIREFTDAVANLTEATTSLRVLTDTYGPHVERVNSRLDVLEKLVEGLKTREQLRDEYEIKEEKALERREENMKWLIGGLGTVFVACVLSMVWFFTAYGAPKNDNPGMVSNPSMAVQTSAPADAHHAK